MRGPLGAHARLWGPSVYSFFPSLMLVLGVLGCGKSDVKEPPTVPGPVADVHGRVIRGDQPVAGVHVLARVTYGVGCSVSDSAPGGTVVSMRPTDSTGRFRTTAYPAAGTEQRVGCLYIGATDPLRAETAWAAPRRAPAPLREAFATGTLPVLEIDVPWPE
jgi:hypothetical protein